MLATISTASETGLAPLRQHQIDAIEFCIDKPGAALLMAMGTMKSRCVVELIRRRRHALTLILAPKAVAENVWEGQFERWHPEPFRILNLTGGGTAANKAKRLKQFTEKDIVSRIIENPIGVVIVNYDTARQPALLAELLKTPFDFLVMDEMHRIKSPGGRTSWACKRLAARIPYRVGLTGTPMPLNFTDIYAQYRALDPTIFGTSLTEFRAMYQQPTYYMWEKPKLRPEREKEFQRQLYSIAYRVDDSVLDLPPVIDIERTCTLGAEARRAYDTLRNEMIVWLKSGVVITPANALVRLLRFQQLTGGFLTDDAGAVHEIDRSKRDLLAEILEDIGTEPVVVFCKFRADLDVVKGVCEGLKLTSAELSGTTRTLDTWQRGDASVLACQIQSGGLGIDLTRARYAIFYSVGFNNGDYEQARARIHRPGQRGNATYYHLIAANTVDGYVYRALAEKRDAARAVLENLKEQGA